MLFLGLPGFFVSPEMICKLHKTSLFHTENQAFHICRLLLELQFFLLAPDVLSPNNSPQMNCAMQQHLFLRQLNHRPLSAQLFELENQFFP